MVAMAYELRRADGLIISDDQARLDLERIRDWLAASYWAGDRPAEAVERSIRHSRTFGVYLPDGEQVALIRAMTDLASFAWLADVVVDEAHRGRGIGRWLVGSVVEHLRGLGVPRFVLATRDAHGVYAAVGFEALRVPQMWMEFDTRAHRPAVSDVTG
jgi:GNAT superfamily N-acetyltransferase